MGFDVSIYNKNYVICLNDDINKLNLYRNDVLLADLVLFSSRSFFWMAIDRCKRKKPTFYFSERWFKPPLGLIRFLSPKHIRYFVQLVRFSWHERAYYLGQGRHAIKDLAQFRLFKNRSYNFAYFANVHANLNQSAERDIDVFWCGRMLKWKRVELLIYALNKVVIDFPEAKIVIVGDGPEKGKILSLIEKLCLNRNISLSSFILLLISTCIFSSCPTHKIFSLGVGILISGSNFKTL
jgi:glycosyltransferase involved in cell wall biosynthesis